MTRKEKKSAQAKVRYIANKEDILAKQREYYEANKDKKNAYYEANKERIQAKKKAYRLANIEKYKARDKEYYLLNIEEYKAQAIKYHNANKEAISKTKKAYRESMKDEFHTLYYLPEHHYIGITNQPKIRLRNHIAVGRIVEGFEVVATFKTRREALDTEKHLHKLGYLGGK